MTLFLASLLFSVIVLIYWIILELFTLMFRITGLPDDKARFQVLSILTGAGFTTRESESIVSSRMRRRLAQGTMLFGYVFNVTIVSALVNVFFSLKSAQVDTVFLGLAVPLAIANKVNTILLMDYIGNDSIANVILKEVPESLKEKTLAESGLKTEHNILIMLIERDGIKPEKARAETVFKPGDTLTVFGQYKEISRVFQAEERFF